MPDGLCLDEIDVTTLVPVEEFARMLDVDKSTILYWQSQGRMNRYRTRRVKLQLPYMTYGYGINMELYRDFIRRLNEA